VSLLDAFVLEPFSVNESLLDSFLLEPDAIEVWVALRGDGMSGSGTENDPYDASTPGKFDYLLNSFPPKTTVHIGAGTFQTQGYPGGIAGGWQPKSGQRIVGAGMEDTILQVVNAAADVLTCAIGAAPANFLNGFEVSDLAVDCNLAGQVNTSAACGAISISGAHIAIERVRAYNFGTQSTSVKGSVIAVGKADPTTPQAFDCTIEDCIIEQPSPNNVRETSCLVIGAQEDANGVMAYHRGCVIRNCFIDCAYTTKPLAISGITYVTTTATVTTFIAHGLAAGNYWMVVTGALENSVLSTNFNGSFLVTVPMGSTYVFTYSMPGTPAFQPTGEMYVGKVPSQRVEITAILKSGTGPWTITLTTRTPHNRVIGNNVSVTGTTAALCNGSFPIASIPSPTQLTYTLLSDPGSPALTNGSYVGVDFRAIEADGGIGTIMESNRIYNCTFGCYHDGLSTKDLVIRNNYFRGVNTAIYQKMGGTSPDGTQTPGHAGVSSGALTHSGTDGKTATFTAAQPHGFSIGQAVVVAGAKVSGVLSPYYNGTFAVTEVPNPTQFKYVMAQDPGANADNSPIPTFGALWQMGRLIVEHNEIELILNVISSGWEAPVGICLYDGPGSHGSQFLYQQVVLRGNVIRHVDNASDSSLLPLGIFLDSCLNAICENNHINLDAAQSIRYYTVGAIKFFNNQTPKGALISGAYYTRSGSYLNMPIYQHDTFN